MITKAKALEALDGNTRATVVHIIHHDRGFARKAKNWPVKDHKTKIGDHVSKGLSLDLEILSVESDGHTVTITMGKAPDPETTEEG